MSLATVTTTVSDPAGQVFANGLWRLEFKPNPNYNGPYKDNGINFTRLYAGNLDNGGSFSQTVNRNDTIAPAGSLWTLIVAPNANGQAYSKDLNVNIDPFDAPQLFGGLVPTNIIINPTQIAHAYKDTELVPGIQSGGLYYDVTKQVLKVFDAVNNSWSILNSINNLFSIDALGRTLSGIIFAAAPLIAGVWIICVDIMITQVAANGSINVTVGWNNGVAAQSDIAANISATALTEGGGHLGGVVLYNDALQNITYTVNFNSITGSPIFNVRIRAIFLG